MWQQLTVALIVLVASGYAAWTLMPGAWRRGLARRLGRPLPAAAGCGAGCDHCGPVQPSPAANAIQPITIHRRPR